jgi:hypothetical protein
MSRRSVSAPSASVAGSPGSPSGRRYAIRNSRSEIVSGSSITGTPLGRDYAPKGMGANRCAIRLLVPFSFEIVGALYG